ncbi:hypothetical protein [Parapedobacter sp. 2B3]|uniref:hypothetical protein n=1 Tax=Parapedobacter sp. 2B3 TaxID=3342381 RepID=UPI0035B5CC07
MKHRIIWHFPFPTLLLLVLIAASCKKVIVTPEPPREATNQVVTVYDTVIVTDTIHVQDTTYYTDTVTYTDTLHIIDTIRHIDTIRYVDTIRTTVTDTVRIVDTIKVYDTIRVTIPTTPNVVPPDGEGVLVGNGSGNLTITASTLSGSSSKTIRIREGTYSTITIQNIAGTADAPITITNAGPIAIQQVMETRDIDHVIISGNGSGNNDYGFTFSNLSYRAIRMYGKMNGVTIRNMSFRNIGDYCIAGEANNGRNLSYDGTAATRTERFKILNCLFDNTGSIVFGGQLSRSGDTGFFKDVEIAYNTFQNSEAGNLVIFSNVQDYNIHHNIVEYVNQRNNAHNGIFLMHGNGHFHDNKLTNYQGNAIRAWVFSRGSSAATIEIYNNICYNSRKYSAFEIQEFSNQLVQGKTTFVNAKVYNNTAGKMNTSRDWQGQLLDLYNNSGTLAYYNNLGFELYSSDSYKPVTDMINNMGSTKIVEKANNQYYASQSDAINNATSFVSKHSNIGASLDL